MALANRINVVGTDELARIHEATVQVLETTGVEFKSDEALALFKQNGAEVDGHRVKIPRSLLEKSLESAPSSISLWGRDKETVVTLGEGQTRTHVEPSNGCVFTHDMERGRRASTMADLIDFFKLAHQSPVCTISGAIPVEPNDVPPEERPLRIFFETLKHTTKPLKRNVQPAREIEEMFAMYEVAVGKGFLADHPSVYASVNPLSPLAFDTEPIETIMTYARYNQPVTVLSCALAGISAPMSLLGAAVLQNAEILSGLVLSQMVTPGAGVIYAPATAVPNMMTAQYVTGSPESHLINIVNLQMALDLYHLPTRTMAGLNDAKVPDAQAGFETMQNLMQCMLGGAHVINECLGVLDSIMTNSFEKFIMDEEMISRVLRFMEGVGGIHTDLSAELIGTIGPQGSFLMHPTTMKNCRTAWRPTVSDWNNHEKWEKQGGEDALVRANRLYKERLDACPESTLEPELERDLAAFVAKRLG
ncbi:trimethylamine methyltransferase family protein [Desulfoluna butyratoxydans]|uniref:Methyltransferase n=1 Tax=Desulfoluna butyratoxydans TaxID=231438 RepID=A0A4U8YHZ8_9BACT|nr:trimethylamine methyltransferase family protein [Desulfoluna butyratoxydans]VFQ43201.1 trimethylamine methyltransferase [Desulfoluna butyratoxydans]